MCPAIPDSCTQHGRGGHNPAPKGLIEPPSNQHGGEATLYNMVHTAECSPTLCCKKAERTVAKLPAAPDLGVARRLMSTQYWSYPLHTHTTAPRKVLHVFFIILFGSPISLTSQSCADRIRVWKQVWVVPRCREYNRPLAEERGPKDRPKVFSFSSPGSHLVSQST